MQDTPSYNPGLRTNSFLLLPYGMVTLLAATGFFTPLDGVLSLVMCMMPSMNHSSVIFSSWLQWRRFSSVRRIFM